MIPENQDRVSHSCLEAQRRAQRPERKHPAGADSSAGIDNDEIEILGKRRILKAVVHDNDAGVQFFEHSRAGGPIAADHGGGGLRQQKRLVAHARGIVHGIDDMRPALTPAIAACEKAGFKAPITQKRSKL